MEDRRLGSRIRRAYLLYRRVILFVGLCTGVEDPEVTLVSVNSKNENTRKQGKDQRGVPEVLSCGGHFRQRNTKTVVIKHHARKRGAEGIDIHHGCIEGGNQYQS